MMGFIVGISNLWAPEFGWDPVVDKDAMEDPFLPQYLAALQIMAYFFGTPMKSWCHIAAEMQAGKTGVICALIRLILISANYRLINIKPDSIFVLTGMSDTAWKKQTKDRMPHETVRVNVHHNGGLSRVRTALMRKAGREDGLKNLLIILDESHIAARCDNRPAKEIFVTITSLCPVENWAENNIRFITISATDPAATVGVGQAKEYAKVIRLLTSDEYQSVETLRTNERLHQTFNIVDESSVNTLLSFITATYGDNAKMYHIIRPKASKGALVESIITSLCPTSSVIRWDCSTPSKPTDETSTATVDDINEILKVKPSRPTYIILKNMFYASKTLNDKYVGVLHDRINGKPDTTLQSLLGRACGYGKSQTTHVFTNMEIVHEYITFWRDMPAEENIIVPRQLKKMMPHVTTEPNGSLRINHTRTLPIGGAGGDTSSSSYTSVTPKKVQKNEDDYESIWSPWFATEKEAMDWWRAKGGKPQHLNADADGFLICTASGPGPERLRIGVIEGYKAGKKTTNMPACKPGGKSFRRYVAYGNINDKTTMKFCVHMNTRKE